MWKPGVVILVIASSSIAQVLPPGTPFPMDGATDVPLDVTLRWTQFGPVDSTEIFFGGGADPLSLSAAPAGVTSFMPSIATRSLYPLGTYYWRLVSRRGAVTASTPVYSFTMAGPVGMQFVPLAPCRVVDTREDLGEFGRPHLSAGVVRTFTFTQHHGCGIAGYALAYSLNVTVVPRGPLGYLAIWPGNTTRPFVSTLNSPDGRVKANAAIVTGGDGGNYISAFATNDTDLVIDINGYFTQPIFNSRALAFYPLLPCRVSDTRNPGGALGGPILGAGASRSIPVMSSNCGVPSSALAYSLNATVVPQGALGYLTLWPSGQQQPFVSTLNSPTGIVVANAAIVPAGTGGSISAFVSDASHLVLDINGYFAPEAAAGGLNLNAVSPCRVLDTRGAGGEFGGPILGANATRSYRPPAADCAVPLTASGYSLNATVVPTGPLGYLTLWPAGSGQPFVSTLNAPDGSVTSNAAILPAGGSGSIASFATSQTHLILDVNGYFGIPANCDLKFVPESAAFAFVGGNGSFQAISNCSDTVSPAVSLVPWVHIQSAPAAGTGSGTVTYSVDVGGTPRSGNIRVGHRVFTVLQAGAGPD